MSTKTRSTRKMVLVVGVLILAAVAVLWAAYLAGRFVRPDAPVDIPPAPLDEAGAARLRTQLDVESNLVGEDRERLIESISTTSGSRLSDEDASKLRASLQSR